MFDCLLLHTFFNIIEHNSLLILNVRKIFFNFITKNLNL